MKHLFVDNDKKALISILKLLSCIRDKACMVSSNYKSGKTENGDLKLTVQKGGVIHERTNWKLARLCPIFLGSQFQNFTSNSCFFTFRRASENFDS